ncbi:MAG: ribonuclease T [Enterobacterales bacterium]
MIKKNNINTLRSRFRGFYPVVIDVETAGLNAKTDALLEIAAITLKMDNDGWLLSDNAIHFNLDPFPGALFQPQALAINGININNGLRKTVTEFKALTKIFKLVNKGIKKYNCNCAIIVAHNATFDHNFLMAAIHRTGFKKHPFHPFSTFDTVTLSGLVLGQTVLSKSCNTAGINFDKNKAHSAMYDTERTTKLFCEIVNRWKRLGGWPII